MLLRNRVAIITGAADGMGKATAELFVQEGAFVILADINKDKVDAVCTILGVQTRGHTVDITKPEQIATMVEQTIDEFGRIDVLVNCAGGVLSPLGAASNMDMAHWQPIIDLNLTGTLNVIMAVLPHMRSQKYGKIVNLSSLGAQNPYVSVLHYHAAKAGVESLTKNLAFELAPLNINVNTIAPGPILTSFWDKLLPPNVDPVKATESLAAKEVPLGRMGRAEDVAGVALFLSSSLSDFVTGEKINVGGGIGNIVSQNSTFAESPGNKSL